MKITRYDSSTNRNEIKAMLEGNTDVLTAFHEAVGRFREGIYLALEDKELAGFLGFRRVNSRRVTVYVYVSEPYRRRGIGTELLQVFDQVVSRSQFEHAFCEFTADEDVANFLAHNGYCSFYVTCDMERGNDLIDRESLSEAALLERGIVIRPYKDEDYIDWHNISDVSFFLMREQLGLTPSYYYPPSEADRTKLANVCADKYVMVVDGVITAIGVIKDEEIHLLAVRPDLQSQGYGRRMVSYLNNVIITSQKAEKVKIAVLQGNPAKSLYEKLGFRDVRVTYAYTKYYKPDSRQRAPKGYANPDEILEEFRLHGMLQEDMVPTTTLE